MKLMVELDGQAVELKDCTWAMWASCGCLVAVSLADAGGRVLSSAEEAHKNHSPRKRDRDREIRNGYRWELITLDRYRKDIGTNWECPAHVRKAATA